MLPNIQFDAVEGEQKGQVVKFAAQAATNRFFSLGVERIEAECNIVAKAYLEQWKRKPSESFMSEFGLTGTTYARGLEEIELPYKLQMPERISMKILNSRFPTTPDMAAQTLVYNNNFGSPVIEIALPTLRVDGSKIDWVDFSTTFDCVIYHECMHSSRDSPFINPRMHDGVIRHTKVACEAVENLLKKSSNI